SNEQTLFLPLDPTAGWSDTSFTSTPITLMTINSSCFPVGYTLVTVFTNGIPSASQTVLVSHPVLMLSRATSFAHHGQGTPQSAVFEINLPLSGPPGIECRNFDGIGGGPGSHTIVFYFNNQLTSI